jgi:hypothetical protein
MHWAGKSLVVSTLLAGLSTLPAAAQTVISARSGLVHYVEGAVFLGDQAVIGQPGDYPLIAEGQLFRTGAGRAEVLLQPGVFLRLAEESSVLLLSASITRAEVEFLAGSIIVDAGQLHGSSVTVVANGTPAVLRKSGLYRFDAAAPPCIRVYDGKAQVGSGSQSVEVEKGKLLSLDGSGATRKFDRKDTDEFARWSDSRKEYLTMAYLEASQDSSDPELRRSISDASVTGPPTTSGRSRRATRSGGARRRSR